MAAAPPAQSNTARTEEGSPAHLPYLPGLDGLRALAVAAVLLYHADLPVYGGYLGVESFFVLSGFLITGLLLLDWQQGGRIDLKRFWVRRARRLLPALFLLLAGTLVLTAALLPGELVTLGHDTLAAVTYVTNWYLIAGEQSYFDAIERPPLLQHLWSLAIEEQFYVIWPLVCAVGLRFLRRRGLLALTLLAAAGSAWLMAALYDPGADPSRIYYGTDTRASALLLGAALAMVWVPGRVPAAGSRRVGALLDAVGGVALLGIVAAYAMLHEQHPLLYRGGLLLVALGTALVIAASTHPAARAIPWLLERQPLRWIGLRSYGIYLWHWPVMMLTRPGVDVPYDGWLLQAGRIGLACMLAALSYAFVEQPIRRGALERVWRTLKERHAASAGARQTTTAVTSALPQGEWRRAWERRWGPLVATGALVLGVSCVLAGISQAAIPQTSAGTVSQAPPATSDAYPGRAAALAFTPGARGATPLPEEARATSAGREASAAPDGVPPVTQAPPTPVPPENTVAPALGAELQRVLDAAVADGSIPGAVLSVRLGDGTTWTGASGIANREDGTPMSHATQVRIGSLSKMFTAVVVMQLVQEGALELDAPVSRWLPDLLPDGDLITVRQLLQHTSGLYDYLEDRRFVAEAYRDTGRQWEPRELVDYATNFPLSFEPGSEDAWDYSSTNYVVLGMLVEQVAGLPFAEVLHQRIIAPAGLHHTYIVPDDTVQGAQARGYIRGEDQTDVAMSFAFATANIVTTAEDLRLFGAALFWGDLLELETRAQMEQFVDGKGRYEMPYLAYGLGMMRNRLPIEPGPDGEPRQEAVSRVFGHIGGFGGFRAALWYAPESETLIALGMNQAATDPNDLATNVLNTILRHQGR
ncbi:MAG: hypothetical protein RLZZ387_2751 [Chloroflexota bacterium]|jgi:peptidoglycan/LPS O-acetylase OafA/YrhL/CubicO group peptidase (beta-lactamase class C family)